jgi:hypothetical protein
MTVKKYLCGQVLLLQTICMLKGMCCLALSVQCVLFSCSRPAHEGTAKMVKLLDQVAVSTLANGYVYGGGPRIHYLDSMLAASGQMHILQQLVLKKALAEEWLIQGDTPKAIPLFEEILQVLEERGEKQTDLYFQVSKNLALAFLRLGEQENCQQHHDAASCIVPFGSGAIHQLTDGTAMALQLYARLMEQSPQDVAFRWLHQIAAMALNIPLPASQAIDLHRLESGVPFQPFANLAPDLGFHRMETSGGVVVDDFNNDGLPDIMTTSWGLREQMRLYINTGKGGFVETTDQAGLTGLTGGLNLVQADYDNDGWLDVLVLRGAWLGPIGNHPNSLLRNRGDGTFYDATHEAGILSFFPTQTAVWCDFDRDGWLDLYIGNESMGAGDHTANELYMNNRDGTFTKAPGGTMLNIQAFTKGIAVADFDRDGWHDLYLSTLFGQNYLFRHTGNFIAQRFPVFEEVSQSVGIPEDLNSFPTWFFDANQDGWPDLFVGEFEFQTSLTARSTVMVAEEYLQGKKVQGSGPRLFINEQGKKFRDATREFQLHTVAYAMGSNQGDLNNDGYPDIYLGTGDPDLHSLYPNRTFLNQKGKTFADVTLASGMGHLQKGHGVAIGDFNLDGHQDVFVNIGGAYMGDGYMNALFMNPGQGQGNWVGVDLEGTKSNRKAIGATIKAVVSGLDGRREIYHTIGPGSSFGGNPLRAHLGLGAATTIEQLEVIWPFPHTAEVWYNLPVNCILKLTEGNKQAAKLPLQHIPFHTQTSSTQHHHHH